MIKQELLNYPVLKQVTLKSGSRYYVDPDGNRLTSVTTILDATKDKTHLNEWADKVGHEEANKIKTEAAELGTIMHAYLEQYMLDLPRKAPDKVGNLMLRQLANAMADTVIKKGLLRVQAVHGIEAQLYYPGLYAGTSDLIVTFDNELCIGDFKNTRRMKKQEWIQDYFCQTAAYSLAHDKVMGGTVKKLVIMMVARDLEYQSFVIEGNELEKYQSEFCRRLDRYLDISSAQG